MVPAQWTITPNQAQQLMLLRKEIPKPIAGYLLFDTGARHIAIDRQIAEDLQLPKLEKTIVHGFTSEEEVDQYEALLILPIIPLIPVEAQAISFPIICQTSNIQKHHAEYTTPEGKPLNVIGVLGRTFMQFTKIYYDGLTGSVEIYLDRSGMYPKAD